MNTKTTTHIISKLSPPNDACRLEYDLQTREGRYIRYECGGGLTMHERYREAGGCAFCIGEVGFLNATRPLAKTGWGSSRPRFYRFPCEPCAPCASKLLRLDEIEEHIRELEKEKTTIL